ncbi:RNA polymerase III subunit Rpc25-domain-containing protein [Leucosporidium creatinivorum]|uniref:RNA polymerase III subunit Rpc25-domain-containing protein n=1 Tax=Leucosporidium creatinivorum TaxID=106004 RepID=A0A1Y2DML1_9BASI|nr:RNA polymerase III subunit Rpc25-domain-containing protein [Leucosporidium creatinivorum]
MFTFCIQKDTIRVEAKDFGKDPVAALREEIHRRYANKIIPDVGLCISLLDILDASEGAVLYGDGCYYYKTEFRLIIFRPYIGEAFVGKVQSQSEQGITVSVGFFDDILIPPSLLPEYSAFDPQRRAFFWVVPPDPAPEVRPSEDELRSADPDTRLYIERRDWIRIRVEEEHWDDANPTQGKAPPPAPAPGADGGAPQAPTPATKGRPPYRLVCSMTESGTGVLEWWDEGDEEEEQA